MSNNHGFARIYEQGDQVNYGRTNVANEEKHHMMSAEGYRPSESRALSCFDISLRIVQRTRTKQWTRCSKGKERKSKKTETVYCTNQPRITRNTTQPRVQEKSTSPDRRGKKIEKHLWGISWEKSRFGSLKLLYNCSISSIHYPFASFASFMHLLELAWLIF